MSVWVKSLKGDKELHRQQVVNLKRNKRENEATTKEWKEDEKRVHDMKISSYVLSPNILSLRSKFQQTAEKDYISSRTAPFSSSLNESNIYMP